MVGKQHIPDYSYCIFSASFHKSLGYCSVLALRDRIFHSPTTSPALYEVGGLLLPTSREYNIPQRRQENDWLLPCRLVPLPRSQQCQHHPVRGKTLRDL